ncbi:MAG: primase protein [Microgenomates group bacterium GW2011_GWA2_44_7]|nr:MAG: primase protein [Microgenomates group bacterium GW2011_GWA2_44_7]KKT77884.1 MAG: primase protein [Microgenomates group bacterium GW2011_GWB1_44_8]
MDDIEEVKSKTDIVAIISEYVPIKKAGRNYKGLCPFHGEKTPSFMVSPELQIYKCFGCAASGDVFDFLMKIEGMEFGETLRSLAKKAGLVLKDRVTDTPSGRLKERLYQVNHLTEEFYHFLLTQHRVGEMALKYVLERGISRENIDMFRIGFSPNMWDGLQRYMIQKKKATLDELESAGMIIRKSVAGSSDRSFYDRFRGRLMFPLRDHRGNTVGFSGRIIPGVTAMSGSSSSAEDGPKYLNTPETEIYHKRSILYGLDISRQEVKRTDQVVVVEGETDMISSYQAGVTNVVAIKGSALTEDHVKLLRRFASEMVMALDTDFAGDMAARRGIEMADIAGFSIKVAKLKYGKDPDECAKKSPQLWKDSVKEAVGVYDFLMESAVNRYGLQTAESKRSIGRELIPIWAKISDPIMRATLVKELAKKLDISESVISSEVDKASSKPGEVSTQTFVAKTQANQERRGRLERYLLALAFQKDPKMLLGSEVLNLVDEIALNRIVQLYQENRKKKPDQFRDLLPTELQMVFGELMLIDLSETLDDDKKLEKEYNKVINELKKLDLRAKVTVASKEIERLESDGSEAESTKVQKQLKSLLESIKQIEKENVV